MNNAINSMLEKYEIKNEIDEINSLKEIIQEIVLCGLSRGNFFDNAAFYGGTALRIFYGLDRFSEDLDFSLIEKNLNFDFSCFFEFVEREVNSYGLNLTISKKEKSFDSNIQSAFLKGDTLECLLLFFPKEGFKNKYSFKDIKIKFEIDISPASGASFDFRYKLLPSPHQIRLYDLSSLLAGKIHAILCRNWKSRIKGRDLYDYVFFLSNNAKVNLDLLKNKLIESKYIDENSDFNVEILIELLNKRFREINYKDAIEDVKPFIKDYDILKMWNEEYFINITKLLK